MIYQTRIRFNTLVDAFSEEKEESPLEPFITLKRNLIALTSQAIVHGIRKSYYIWIDKMQRAPCFGKQFISAPSIILKNGLLG